MKVSSERKGCKTVKILAIGDNVCDKYLSRNRMYPGGQCVNTCVYASMNGAQTAFLGKFGSDDVAKCVQGALTNFGVDISRCRYFDCENGFACVTLDGSDRVFIGSNKGGPAAEKPYDFTDDDFAYMKGFDLIYSDLNAFIEDDIQAVAATGVPVAFDFSTRWTDEYLARICPHIKAAVMSCAHLSADEREREMRKAAAHGVPVVLGTVGEDGSHLLYTRGEQKEFLYAEAVKAEDVIDTMGAGDAYFAAFLTCMLERAGRGKNSFDGDEDMSAVLAEAMRKGAEFSAKICCMEGAFGCGVPLTGRIIDNRKAN